MRPRSMRSEKIAWNFSVVVVSYLRTYNNNTVQIMKLKHLLILISLCAGIHQASAQGYIANLDAAQDGGGLRTGSGQVFLFLTGRD